MLINSFFIGLMLGIAYGLWVSFDLPRVFNIYYLIFFRFLRFISTILIFTYILRQPQLHSILILIVFIVSLWLTILTTIRARPNGTS